MKEFEGMDAKYMNMDSIYHYNPYSHSISYPIPNQ